MNVDFWKQFASSADALEAAIARSDSVALSELTNNLAQYLAGFEPQLNLNIGGPDPFRLSILPLPGAEKVAESFLASGTPPDHWEVSVGIPEIDPIETVHVKDENGESISVKYADLQAKVLPPQDGMVTIVFSLDGEFETTGPHAHLYHAVARNLVSAILGGRPRELAKVVLLPRSQTGDLLPLQQLRQQWIDTIGNS